MVNQLPEEGFMSPLLNVWKFVANLGKSTGECKNKHSNKFSKFLKIFGNLRRSSEKIEKRRKVLKTTFQHFDLFKIFGNCRKSSEIVGEFPKLSSRTSWKFSKIFGNLRKCSENFGKFSNVIGCLLFQSDTCGLKIRFVNLHWCYSLTALLLANQNRVIFSGMLLMK